MRFPLAELSEIRNIEVMKNMTEMSDEQLIAMFVNGNNRAFEAIYDRHNEYLYSYVMSIVKNAAMAEDFVQDTYVKVMLNLKQGRYIHKGKLLNWMLSVAHNIVFDYYRSLQAQCSYCNIDDEVQLYLSEVIVDDSYCEYIESEERFLSLEKAVARLSDEQREVISLHYFNNVSFRDISTLKSLSINTILGRMHYAVLNLRKSLGNVAMM